MNRRNFIQTTLAATGAMVTASTSYAQASGLKLEFALPELGYSYQSLEPVIDAQTMQIHHSLHHGAYVKNLNAALEGVTVNAKNLDHALQSLLADPTPVPEDKRTAFRNNGGGHFNHDLFWKILAPAGQGGAISDRLLKGITDVFGDLEKFQEAFGSAGVKQFGSGWAWLIVKADGALAITSTPNQDNPLMKTFVAEKDQGTPILGLDVWEHAYYLKYQNKRADYVKAFWQIVNWKEVSARYEAALG